MGLSPLIGTKVPNKPLSNAMTCLSSGPDHGPSNPFPLEMSLLLVSPTGGLLNVFHPHQLPSCNEDSISDLYHVIQLLITTQDDGKDAGDCPLPLLGHLVAQ